MSPISTRSFIDGPRGQSVVRRSSPLVPWDRAEDDSGELLRPSDEESTPAWCCRAPSVSSIPILESGTGSNCGTGPSFQYRWRFQCRYYHPVPVAVFGSGFRYRLAVAVPLTNGRVSNEARTSL